MFRIPSPNNGLGFRVQGLGLQVIPCSKGTDDICFFPASLLNNEIKFSSSVV